MLCARRVNKYLIALLLQQTIIFSYPGVNLCLSDPVLNGFAHIIPVYSPKYLELGVFVSVV